MRLGEVEGGGGNEGGESDEGIYMGETRQTDEVSEAEKEKDGA